ncbi:hypothetical protein BAY61_16415 [Prauserella marina]|uniref:phospholipase D n=1 Tax=Prauserella marina TaxID=530584 RepID=A0A222VR06_9PSEU|nr:phospholipase D-like domain-containing protein [Prauserella marina]ASR36330.1 hypothetical protein BAY61_16415 [Prauserella marina]PWV77113.1 phosphatidylserine/phosphatidylglycerophosphate/cardiolipin synthase-like enzyme [Prauserella marina]SDD04719.1 Phosphatidylserine/phosphatidylglycerophosphate/cardiolipin synthase [Prauserella marina]
MRVKPLLAALACALSATLLAAPSGAAADDPVLPCRDAPRRPVTTGAVLNDPAGGDPTAVVRQVCNLVKQAPEGSRIRIAHFVISGEAGMDFANELIGAHRRGVDVQVVLDGWQADNPAVDALRAEIGTREDERSWLHVCTRTSPEGNTAACIGTKGQHNKFYLFSKTGGKRDVVLQSSANFTDVNSRTYWNNAVTFTGNPALYRAYDSYFEDLAAERATDDYYRTATTLMRGGIVKFSFFPRAEGDPVVENLAKVGCWTPTTVRIGMSEWDDYRIGIARRVVELAERGCSIKIVHGLMDDEVREVLSGHPGIAMRELGDANALPGRIHSKFVLIEGQYGLNPVARWVLTGSPNFNHTSLRCNDEALIQTNLGGVYAEFRRSFDGMFVAAT